MLAQLRGDALLVSQQREVADNGGQRRFKIVREIDDKVVFALVRLLSRAAAGEHVQLNAVHLVFDHLQVVGKRDGLVAGFVDLLGGGDYVLQIAERACPVVHEQDDIPRGEHDDDYEGKIAAYPLQQAVDRVRIVPVDGGADHDADEQPDEDEDRIQHDCHDEAREHPAGERAPEAAHWGRLHLGGGGVFIFTQPDNPPPRRF